MRVCDDRILLFSFFLPGAAQKNSELIDYSSHPPHHQPPIITYHPSPTSNGKSLICNPLFFAMKFLLAFQYVSSCPSSPPRLLASLAFRSVIQGAGPSATDNPFLSEVPPPPLRAPQNCLTLPPSCPLPHIHGSSTFANQKEPFSFAFPVSFQARYHPI